MGSTDREFDRQILAEIEAQCAELGLTASAASSHKLRAFERRPVRTLGELRELYSELHGRLIDELKASVLLFVEPDKASLFTEQEHFGSQVTSQFPASIQDVEEAAKCLALGRNTACVFHLMRVMETGLRALGASLGDAKLDANANPTWERILARGDEELRKTADKRSPEWKAKPEFYAEAIASLRAVKTAWRNPTMHVRGVYDEEKALDIFHTVRSFMRHLATELHE